MVVEDPPPPEQRIPIPGRSWSYTQDQTRFGITPPTATHIQVRTFQRKHIEVDLEGTRYAIYEEIEPFWRKKRPTT